MIHTINGADINYQSLKMGLRMKLRILTLKKQIFVLRARAVLADKLYEVADKIATIK